MSRLLTNDTIVALATAPVPSGVAVIRLSGKQALAAAQNLCPAFKNPKPRRMHYGALTHNGEVIDRGLWVYFAAPNSFTGEDVVEFQGHGGIAVTQAAINAFLAQPNVRQAEAGEYTRRAFLNGRMDLTAAEGLADLIGASTDAQRRQALRQMDGALGAMFEDWRTRILHLLAHVEAAVDFPDEELDVLQEAGLAEKLNGLIAQLQAALATRAGERLRDGFSAVIAGRPNAGKSTLTNLLTGRETAIVSPIAGTTRDVVEAHLDIGGLPLVLADTAGLRQTTDSIEEEGVRRALKRADSADLLLLVVDGGEWPNLPEEVLPTLIPERTLVIASKADTLKTTLPAHVTIGGIDVPVLALDLRSENALPPLLAALEKKLKDLYGVAGEAAQLTRARHRAATEQALDSLNRAALLFAGGHRHSVSDLLAQDLRDAAAAIGSVTGRTDVEDVLDLVFSTFCIGK